MHFTSLGTALRFLGSNHFSGFLRRWYLQRGTGFQRPDARFGDGETFWQVSPTRHVDGLRVDSNTCWFITAWILSVSSSAGERAVVGR